MSEVDLIEGYKKDFLLRTGKRIRIRICSRWESYCELPVAMAMDEVIMMILDALDCTYDAVFVNSRREAIVFKRGLIYFILVHNGYSLLKIAKRTQRDHTTIIHARKKFEELLESEPLYSSVLREVMDYIRQNYQYYLTPPSR